ncbi:amidase [Raoultella ornithinolytica]|uniref:amidase n=1 Tax=Raoultella ornithinolytica TaxID=54291 RepID=UPI002259E5D5|nr:amidase family protein [Raoultella ornithinolytica]MCX3410136.1 amidase family protein [Raoultella ornithinolytica]
MANEHRTGMTSAHSGFISRFTLGTGALTFAAKDTLDIAGYPTRAGSPVLQNAPEATTHATVIQQLLDSGGCQLQGKTTLHELAFGVTGINAWSGTPLNPRYPALIPGGSSSGSATVVAAGEVDFAIGTDTGGSVRMPAACCGIVGLKPTWGRVSRQGVMPADSSLDCVGFFSRDVATLRQVLARLPGEIAPAVSAHQAATAFLFGHATTDIEQLIRVRLAQAGMFPADATLPAFAEAHQAGLTVISQENWQAFQSLAEEPELAEDVAVRLRAGAEISPHQRQAAERIRQTFTEAVDAQLARTPFILLPTLPACPPTLEEAANPLNVVNLTRLVRPFNLSGHPALTLPVGEINQRPVALQIVAGKNKDYELLCFAESLMAKLQYPSDSQSK